MCIGVLIGGALIVTGLVKTFQAKSPVGNQTQVSVTDLEEQVDDLEEELIPLKAQKSQEFSTNGFSENYYRLDKQISDIQEEISELKTQIWKIESGYNDDFSNDIGSKVRVAPYYMFGGFIIIFSCMISGSIYMMAKRREMLAFGLQQVMPVAQEGIEKIAPTMTKVGKEMVKGMAPAYGEMAKEISKGIKEGLNGKDEEK